MLTTIYTGYNSSNEAVARRRIVERVNQFKEEHPNEGWRTVQINIDKRKEGYKIDAYSPIGECKEVYSYRGYAILEK